MTVVICPDCDASFDDDAEEHRCLGPERVARRRTLERQLRELESKLAAGDAESRPVRYNLAITAFDEEIARRHHLRRHM